MNGEKLIIIEIMGGVALLASSLPPGVSIELRDYDILGCGIDPDRIIEGEDGDYVRELFTHPERNQADET